MILNKRQSVAPSLGVFSFLKIFLPILLSRQLRILLSSPPTHRLGWRKYLVSLYSLMIGRSIVRGKKEVLGNVIEILGGR